MANNVKDEIWKCINGGKKESHFLFYFLSCGKKEIREFLKGWKSISIELEIDGSRSWVFCSCVIHCTLWRVLEILLISYLTYK